MRNALLFSIIAMLAVPCFADTLIVDLSGSGDYLTIQSAIDAAQEGDTVLVRDGIYAGEGNRDIIIDGKSVTVQSENGPEQCIIDCQGTEQTPHRGFKISRNLWEYVIDGFTITNGYAPEDIKYFNSKIASTGGAIVCYKGSSPTILNSVFFNNYAKYGGGVMSMSSSNPFISNCKFIGNVATQSGGGFHSGYYGEPIIERCIFQQNKAGYVGGGIYLYQAHLSNHHYNSEYDISNCLISGNFAGSRSGGIHVHQSEVSFINCSIVENRALHQVGGVNINSPPLNRFTNCILWNNVGYGKSDRGVQIYGPSSKEYCYIQGIFNENKNEPRFRKIGYWDNNGTPEDITDDNWISGDYHLLSSSPCIDSGHPSVILTEYEVDLDGNPRIQNGRIDMGVYEFVNATPVANATDVTGYAWVDGYALVKLDGVGSYDEDGDVLEYYWYDGKDLIATGAEPNVVLPVGEHVIDLVVNDGIEDSEPDSCVVTVVEPFETVARMLPGMINLKSQRPRLIGRIEFAGEQAPVLDPNEAMLLLVGVSEVEAGRQMLVYADEETAWYLVGFFDSAAVTENLTGGTQAEMTLVSRFESGQWVYGRDVVTVK
jgi:hypothetical protein